MPRATDTDAVRRLRMARKGAADLRPTGADCRSAIRDAHTTLLVLVRGLCAIRGCPDAKSWLVFAVVRMAPPIDLVPEVHSACLLAQRTLQSLWMDLETIVAECETVARRRRPRPRWID